MVALVVVLRDRPSSSPRPRRCAGRASTSVSGAYGADQSSPARRRARRTGGTQSPVALHEHPARASTSTGSGTRPWSSHRKCSVVAEAGRTLQRAVQLVRPGVVGAHRPRWPARAVGRQQLVAAVPAGVGERVDGAGGRVTRQQHLEVAGHGDPLGDGRSPDTSSTRPRQFHAAGEEVPPLPGQHLLAGVRRSREHAWTDRTAAARWRARCAPVVPAGVGAPRSAVCWSTACRPPCCSSGQ